MAPCVYLHRGTAITLRTVLMYRTNHQIAVSFTKFLFTLELLSLQISNNSQSVIWEYCLSIIDNFFKGYQLEIQGLDDQQEWTRSHAFELVLRFSRRDFRGNFFSHKIFLDSGILSWKKFAFFWRQSYIEVLIISYHARIYSFQLPFPATEHSHARWAVGAFLKVGFVMENPIVVSATLQMSTKAFVSIFLFFD